MPTGHASLQGLGSVQLISSGQWCCSRRPYARSRVRQAFTCQIRAASKSPSSGVVMRELPLPGTSDTVNNRRDFQHTKPAPRADNGLGSRSDASANDAARRGSGKEASTSSSGSVTFQPLQQSSLARTNGAALRQTQQRSDNNTYDATIAVNQAAPGFAAASRSAVAATEQRAESLIDAGQSMPAFSVDSDFRWSRDNYNNTQRSIDIWTFIITLRTKLWLLDQKWSYLGGWTELKKTDRLRSTASWTRESLLKLGPTFIKVGQLFSTRSDLFPAAFTDELAKLQDRVPAFAPAKAMAIIESELGAPAHQLFRSFQEQPIAAASLGQVRHNQDRHRLTRLTS
ncbi:TPA: hypothetical protein ACH3X1_010464 [Trebouxia sp. C0004]